jgi:hypothetical protein
MRKLSILLALVAGLFVSEAKAVNFSGKDAALATIIFNNPGNCTTGCTPVFQYYDGTNLVTVVTAGADAVSNTLNGLPTYARMLQFNGTTWDRWQGAVKIASGGVASGAIASGAFASGSIGSGAVASGAVASGAYAAGSLAAGAGVDGWDLTQGAIADAAVTAGATGSVSAKLRSISRDVGTVATNSATQATAANQTTANTSLATIATNTGAAIPVGGNYVGQASPDPSKGGGTPSSVAINVSTATTTQLVAISGSTSIYVTSFDVIAGGTGNITFEYGTGASCGTGTTALTGAYNLTAQAGIAKGNGLGTVLKVPSGNALCVLTSAAVQMSGSLSFQQF